MSEKQDKKRRQIMRHFLSDIAAVSMSQQFKAKEKFILNLPEKLFIMQSASSKPDGALNEIEQNDAAFLLSDLFGDSTS
jgi:uncharacterized protein YbcI